MDGSEHQALTILLTCVDRRGTFFGVFSIGPQLAFVLGPTLGGIVASSQKCNVAAKCTN
jgi:MFS family permease